MTSPYGLGDALYQKVALEPMLMFDGPLEVLFYALPPNSQLLFSKPEIEPLFEDFDGPVEPRGCVESRSGIKQNVLRI